MWVGGGGARKSKDCPVKMDEFPGEWTPVLTVHVVHNDRRSNMELGGSSRFSCCEYVKTYIHLYVPLGPDLLQFHILILHLLF